MAWFDHREGRVVVNNPDEEIIRKMFEVAMSLRAKVIGDDGEEYDEKGQSNWQELRQPADETKKKPWWKIW